MLKRFQSLVDTHPSDDVTRIGEEEDSNVDVEALWKQVTKLYDTGLHPSISLTIRHRGRQICERTVGHVHNPPEAYAPEDVSTPDTLYNLFSASKIVTATLVHALAEDGAIDLDDPIVKWVPEFGEKGKSDITLRHLLNHTGGIPDMPEGLDPEEMLAGSEDGFDLSSIYGLQPLNRPGDKVAYHSIAGWMVIQEVVERATGRPLRELLVERLLAPLGFETLRYGVPEEDIDKVARHAVTGPPAPGFVRRIFQRNIGVRLHDAVAWTNQPEFLTATLPSANVIGTGREIARFMQLLLNRGELDGVRVLRADTVDRMVGDTTRLAFDGTFGIPMRYGLGVMMGGKRFSLFGAGTRGAYGHIGLSQVVVYADPSRDLAVSFLNTGKPMLAPGSLRWAYILQSIVNEVPKK